MVYIFLFKRKTAYELRISDWSSDGCASDPSSAPSSTRPTSPARRRPSGAGPSPCSASAASPPRSAPTASSARLGKRFAVGRYRAAGESAPPERLRRLLHRGGAVDADITQHAMVARGEIGRAPCRERG